MAICTRIVFRVPTYIVSVPFLPTLPYRTLAFAKLTFQLPAVLDVFIIDIYCDVIISGFDFQRRFPVNLELGSELSRRVGS